MAQFQDLLVAELPHLRAFARMLARNPTLADDLVQETILRALTHVEKFTPGTNLKAWLATILRNQFYNELRHRARIAAYDTALAPLAGCDGDQEAHLALREFEAAYYALPAAQREALTLVGASGFSYAEAARIAGCAEGTIKSRVSRARIELGRRLAPESGADISAAA